MGKRAHPVRRRPGSFASRLDSVLLPYVSKHRRATHEEIAIALSPVMGRTLTRQQIWHALNDNCLIEPKDPSTCFYIPRERADYEQQLFRAWRQLNQVIFIGEKKILRSEISGGAAGPLAAAEEASFSVVGALSAIVGEPGLTADNRLGPCTFNLVDGDLSTEEIRSWLDEKLASCLTPYPGPRSVVVSSLPRTFEPLLDDICESRGALLFWNPECCPRLNPIERLWTVAKTLASRKHAQLMSGQYGRPRAVDFDDLARCIVKSRLPEKTYDDVFNHL